MLRRIILLALSTIALAPAGAGAQELATPYAVELRGGVFAHSVDVEGEDSSFGFLDLTRIEDANVELLFASPDLDLFRWIGSPRPHIGATVNFGGLESMAYAGLTWTVPVFDTPLFVEGSFGGAVHNGELDGAAEPGRDLGCSVLFRESASLGYQFTPQASAMLTLEHASHAHLCGSDNRGLTNLGMRFGYKF